MKKFLTVLNLFLLFTLILLTLYVFDIIDIPFLHKEQVQEKVPRIEKTETPTQITEPEQTDEPTETVTRKKTYDELMKKGDVYYEKGFYHLAIDSYTQANQSDPNDITSLIKIGEIQLKLNEFEQAKELATAILKREPTSVEGKLMLGKAHIGLEEFAEAKSVFDSTSSDNQGVQYYQGIMALFFGEYERGRNLLTSVINNENPTGFNEYAQKFINAMDEFDRYQAGQHDHLKVLLARSYVQTANPLMAKSLLWNVLEETRTYRDAWIILGYSYLKLGQFQEAIDALEEAKNQDPEKPETLFYLGLAYAGNDEIDKAIEILELASENGYEPKIHVEQKLAELYFQKEDYDKASEKYEEVITLNSSDVNYFVRPVYIYIEKTNNPDKAVALAEKAQIHNPDDPMSYNLLGWAYVANNDYINGKKNLEKAIKYNENFDAPYLNLGWMYEKQGKYDSAKALYKKAYEIGGNSPVGNLAADRYNSLLDRDLNQGFMVNIFN